MPSDALLVWQADRMPRLQNIEADCLYLQGMYPADPDRVQEHIRSYAILLSSEFQGFARDLHSECADRLVDFVGPASLQTVLRSQCVYARKLDHGNPNPGNPAGDFNRYLFDLWGAVIALDPAHGARHHRLAALNAWRNAIAHHNYDPAELGGTTTLTILEVRDWLTDCNAFAVAFDRVMRDHLQATTGLAPWPP